MTRFQELVDIVDTLRGDGGCPWDRAQTARSLLPYLLEETHEVMEAVERGDPVAERSELGDLLYLVLLLIRVGAERGRYDLEAVAGAAADKMRRRHPGLFDPAAEGPRTGTVAEWEAEKARERGGRSQVDGIPATLPALLRAHRVGEKLSRVGFDWPDLDGVRAKVAEETAELDEALASGDAGAVAWEYGDLLLAVSQVGRFIGVPAEDALRGANRRFEERFRVLEGLAAARGLSLHGADLDTLEALWQEAKGVEQRAPRGSEERS